jgi:hypothetical protein
MQLSLAVGWFFNHPAPPRQKSDVFLSTKKVRCFYVVWFKPI